MPRSTGGARWSWTTGERGLNRVRVFTHPKSGRLFLEWFEPVGPDARPRARTLGLGHTDRNRAKGEAEDWALKVRRGDVPRLTPAPVDPGSLVRPMRLGWLFDNYLRDVTPRKKGKHHDKRAAALFTALYGREKVVDSLCERDWRRYIDRRTSGDLAPEGRAGTVVRTRVVEQDLRWLMAVLNWATKQKDDAGKFWLTANPLRGQVIPSEKNPHQPMLSEEQYAKLLEKAPDVDPRLTLALVLCHETGHRLNSVRQLRWSDVDLDERVFAWRAETDKSGKAHQTAMTDTAVVALQSFRRHQSRIGDGWVFPSPSGDVALSRERFYRWFRKATEQAEISIEPRCAFHAFRRGMASALVTEQLAVVKALGGWNAPHVVVGRYQKVSLDVQREVLARRRIG